MTDPISQQQLITGGGKAGAKPNIDDVFALDSYRGDSFNTTKVNNGIDLAGEGGLVIVKQWNDSERWDWRDTVRGAGKSLTSQSNAAETNESSDGFAFNSDGFTRGDGNTTNQSNKNYLAATFRKSPGFLDIISYTGNGIQGRTISHELGCVPGMIIIKHLDGTSDWPVYHKGVASADQAGYYLILNSEDRRTSSTQVFGNVMPTATQFTIGNDGKVNTNGQLYIAYVFAGANDAASKIFGPDEDSEIIKCGYYDGNSSTQTIDLGWPADLVLIKSAAGSGTNHWGWFDHVIEKGRWAETGYGDGYQLKLNANDQRAAWIRFMHDARGFHIQADGNFNQNSVQFAYMAIRQRGPKICKTVDDGALGSDYYAAGTGTNQANCPPGAFLSGPDDASAKTWPVDFGLVKEIDGNGHWNACTRDRWTYYWQPDNSDRSNNSHYVWPSSLGWATDQSSNFYSWMFRNGPGFQTLNYHGNGSARTITHNMGVTPEMIWIKNMNKNDINCVGHKDLNGGVTPWNYYLATSETNAEAAYAGFWNNTSPGAQTFSVGGDAATNQSGSNMVAYLFASFEGMCKVSSYTGTGVGGDSNSINCGFAPRFLLVKRISGAGPWYLWDTGRGDYALLLDFNGAQAINTFVNFTATGFSWDTDHNEVNGSGDKYIYYAHA